MLQSKQQAKMNQARGTGRTQTGSGIILAVVCVFLITTGSVLAVLLLMNTGVATYNKEKLGFIANQAATYAASWSTFFPDNATRQQYVTDMVNGMISGMGLNSSNTTVTVSDTTMGAQQAVSVEITANLPGILTGGFSSIIPQQIQSSFTAVQAKNPYATFFVIATDPFGGQATGTMIVPASTLPQDQQPAYVISMVGVSRVRAGNPPSP